MENSFPSSKMTWERFIGFMPNFFSGREMSTIVDISISDKGIRKCTLVKETGNDLEKVITYLQTNLGDDIKIPALTEEKVTHSMTDLEIIKRKSQKGRGQRIIKD